MPVGTSVSAMPDGSLIVGVRRLRIQNYRVIDIVGSGANGAVARAQHRYLSHEAAVKVWLKLKVNDARNKFKQGIAEARKAAAAERIDHTHAVRVFDAGNAGGLFFAVMEYFPGITARRWLAEQCPPLSLRCWLAFSVVEAAFAAMSYGVIHGDLHLGNVLVALSSVPPSQHCPDFRIVDYGTSVFSKKEHSLMRHWRVLEETVSTLVSPFNTREFSFPFRPRELSERSLLSVLSRYRAMFTRITCFVHSLGVVRAVPPAEDDEWESTPADYSHLIGDEWRERLRQLIASGRIRLDTKWLGTEKEWWA